MTNKLVPLNVALINRIRDLNQLRGQNRLDGLREVATLAQNLANEATVMAGAELQAILERGNP